MNQAEARSSAWKRNTKHRSIRGSYIWKKIST